jgi:hypothetical protein
MGCTCMAMLGEACIERLATDCHNRAWKIFHVTAHRTGLPLTSTARMRGAETVRRPVCSPARQAMVSPNADAGYSYASCFRQTLPGPYLVAPGFTYDTST